MSQFEFYTSIDSCRLCHSEHLEEVWDLGNFALTSAFPSSTISQPRIPIVLMKCLSGCGLLQLKHNTSSELLFSSQYGYRSSTNSSMKSHLLEIVRFAESFKNLTPGDIVVDIGSNDGTTLSFFTKAGLKKIGFDPSPRNWENMFYGDSVLINDYFSAKTYEDKFSNKAKIVLSISIFYDVANPTDFANEVVRILDDDGLWIIEQSYAVQMVATNSFDTLCHEHLTYFGISQLNYLAKTSGFKIIEVRFNATNGGSFIAVLAKEKSQLWKDCKYDVIGTISQEKALLSLSELLSFKRRVEQLRSSTISTLRRLVDRGPVAALGASTKGNVLLQYYGIDSSLINQIGEVLPAKYGCFTPGSNIPIVSEKEILENYKQIVVLPWHFRQTFLNKNYKRSSIVVFPLPSLEIIEL